MTSHAWRAGFRPQKVKPDAAAEELVRIREENGALTAEATFEASQPKDAVLHPEFEWDGKSAIRELGLIRARRLIRSIVFVSDEKDEPPTSIYVHVPPPSTSTERAGVYEPISVVVQHEDQFDRALRALHSHVEAAEQAVRELERAAQKTGNGDHLAKIALAVAATSALREAIAAIRG